MTARNDPFRQRLLDEMESLATIDCHSHTLLRREYEQQGERSLFTISSYFERDVSGLIGRPAAALYDGATSDAERWQRLRAILARTRNVSYWRHNVITYQGLFGLEEDDVTDENWEALNARIKEYTARPAWYEHVTRQRRSITSQRRSSGRRNRWRCLPRAPREHTLRRPPNDPGHLPVPTDAR